MPHITAPSGIEWHYRIEGEGADLLFIHGWGVDGRIWRQQAKHFSDKYRVLTIDLPGHGKSGWEKITLDVMSRDLDMILTQLDIDKLTIIGSSLGGLLALKFYSNFAQHIQQLIFVGSMPKFSKSEDYPFGLDIKQMRKLSRQLDTAYPSIVNVFFRSLFTKEERQTRRFKWLQKFRKTDIVPMRNALADYLDIMEHEDLRDILLEIELPVAFINGTDDQICCKKTIEFLRNLKPSAHFVFFDKCGHFPFLSKAHEFNEVLEEILDNKV